MRDFTRRAVTYAGRWWIAANWPGSGGRAVGRTRGCCRGVAQYGFERREQLLVGGWGEEIGVGIETGAERWGSGGATGVDVPRRLDRPGLGVSSGTE